MKLTKKKAKELSILKWEYIVSNKRSDEGLIDKCPELKELKAHCGYCAKYSNGNCKNCPINLGLNDGYGSACMKERHPYNKWWEMNTKANAQKVLDLIRES